MIVQGRSHRHQLCAGAMDGEPFVRLCIAPVAIVKARTYGHMKHWP